MTDIFVREHLKSIMHLLRESSGFNPESMGWSIFSNIIKQRMEACLVDDIAGYANVLEHSDVERNALIEATVIPETWFFRDPSAFNGLEQIAAAWHGTDAPLRILSVPCASGEEPYSIVITLLEAGLMPNRFHLDAADISRAAITKAIQAVYTDNAFRGTDLDFRERYFSKTLQGYKLIPAITDHVVFSKNNFFSIQYHLAYDIIFCRNLLIYFDQETRAQAFSRLNAMLGVDGLLFLGHAEAMQAVYHGWATTAYTNAFRKASVAPLGWPHKKPC